MDQLELLIGQRTREQQGIVVRGPIPSVSATLFHEVMSLRWVRNEMVHGMQLPVPETLLSSAARLREIVRELESTKPTSRKRSPRKKR